MTVGRAVLGESRVSLSVIPIDRVIAHPADYTWQITAGRAR
jgi:hypothetical protein